MTKSLTASGLNGLVPITKSSALSLANSHSQEIAVLESELSDLARLFDAEGA